jgi:hypothetical protein
MTGDSGGDSGVAGVGRPGGRFWALASPESSDDEVETISPFSASGSPSYAASPTTIKESSSRVVKRFVKRRNQQEAARVLFHSPLEVCSLPAVSSPSPSSPSRPSLKIPVLSPSTFLLQNFNASEWIRVFRRNNRASRRCISGTV